MTAAEVATLLRDTGGYGVAALMWWFWRQADNERQRYRDLHEQTLSEMPLLTEALKELTNEVARQNSHSVLPRTTRE
jgi:hypothetical protein